MQKEMKIVIDNNKMEIIPSNDVTNYDVITVAINLFELAKENIEKELSKEDKLTLEDFIYRMCKSSDEEDKNDKSDK